MPSCANTIIGSVLQDCLDSIGGIKELKVKVFDSALTGHSVASGVDTLSGGALSGWYLIETQNETSSFGSELTTDRANGTSVYAETVTAIVNKLTAAKRNWINNAKGQYFHVAVRDGNDNVWLFGYTRGVVMATSITSGVTMNDRNGISITFTGREPNGLLSVSNSWTALISA